MPLLRFPFETTVARVVSVTGLNRKFYRTRSGETLAEAFSVGAGYWPSWSERPQIILYGYGFVEMTRDAERKHSGYSAHAPAFCAS